jgi:prepilin-type N-terminal cleavage/methylation domain-containing protein
MDTNIWHANENLKSGWRAVVLLDPGPGSATALDQQKKWMESSCTARPDRAVQLPLIGNKVKNMSMPKISAGGAVCTPNINTAERRKRLTFGLIELLISLVILGVLLTFGVSRWWRLALLPFFLGSASGFFQWRDHT